MRHDEIFNARKNNQQITIIGAGAVGSRIFASLVELGLTKIQVIDFDNVEAHNLANQIFNYSDIGKPKVQACYDWYKLKTGHAPPDTMEFINAKVPAEGVTVKGSVFLVTDSMASRREIFESVLRDNTGLYRVIECRMAATHGNIYAFTPGIASEQDSWVATLIDDDLAETSACGTSLTVGATAAFLANLAVWQFIHAKLSPEIMDSAIDVFLQPTVITTRNLCVTGSRKTAVSEEVQGRLESNDQNDHSAVQPQRREVADSILL